ncbi:hypothetical protein [Streptomyces curacoi]|uniref:Uncharacterized protein n=1 Tax=Streptomyces curacoi TaxID=146536 RepID=A0A117NW25_9ACTN|nr:hypothetical protein [Streptomyces curacoi]KUM68499.1 hypothetical protein AQI70_33595 [Streptomyces curacoi]
MPAGQSRGRGGGGQVGEEGGAGIAAGALLGGALLPVVGVRGTFLVGGLLTAGALAVLSWPVRAGVGERAGMGRYRADAGV